MKVHRGRLQSARIVHDYSVCRLAQKSILNAFDSRGCESMLSRCSTLQNAASHPNKRKPESVERVHVKLPPSIPGPLPSCSRARIPNPPRSPSQPSLSLKLPNAQTLPYSASSDFAIIVPQQRVHTLCLGPRFTRRSTHAHSLFLGVTVGMVTCVVPAARTGGRSGAQVVHLVLVYLLRVSGGGVARAARFSPGSDESSDALPV